MKIEKTYSKIDIGYVVETNDKFYLVVKMRESEYKLLDMEYMTVRKKPYYNLDFLLEYLNSKGVPTHGGSCHKKVIALYSKENCKMQIKVLK